MATGLKPKRRRATVGGSKPPSKGPAVAPKPRKKLTPAEKRTSEGRFAVVLEKLLAERGVTTQQLADRIEVKEPTVRAWLRAQSIPGDVRLFKAIAKALNSPEHPIGDWRLIIPVDL